MSTIPGWPQAQLCVSSSDSVCEFADKLPAAHSTWRQNMTQCHQDASKCNSFQNKSLQVGIESYQDDKRYVRVSKCEALFRSELSRSFELEE